MVLFVIAPLLKKAAKIQVSLQCHFKRALLSMLTEAFGIFGSNFNVAGAHNEATMPCSAHITKGEIRRHLIEKSESDQRCKKYHFSLNTFTQTGAQSMWCNVCECSRRIEGNSRLLCPFVEHFLRGTYYDRPMGKASCSLSQHV